MTDTLLHGLLAAIVGLPALALVVLAIPAWFRHPLGERAIGRITGTAFAGAAVAAAVVATAFVVQHRDAIHVEVGPWFIVGERAFYWSLIGDRLSLPFALFSVLLVGIIGAFSRRYLHRERGFVRFYVLLSLFGAAVLLVVLAGDLDLVFFGWELVGLTSALLIAFFHDRSKPVEHGLRAYVTYRACDVGILAALVWLHHTVHTSSIEAASSAPWAGFVPPHSSFDATLVAVLLLWGSMGKAAQAPLGGWLPRAMEGPTPSSAIFYGAISVHLGPFLLLRAAPLFERSPFASALVILVGLVTAVHATLVGRTQTDIKSALAYASMTQLGIIFVEIGLGLHTLAVVHIIGHACIRSLQILRAPSLLHEHHELECAMACELPRTGAHLERLVPRTLQPWLYRLALERGYFDVILREYVVGSLLRGLRWIDGLDQAWVRMISGEDVEQRPPVVRKPAPGHVPSAHGHRGTVA